MRIPPPKLRALQLPRLVTKPNKDSVIQRQHNVKDHPVDFESFAFIVLTFCLLSPHDLHRTVFDMVDINGNNELEQNEIEFLILGVNNGEPQFGRQKSNKSSTDLIALFDRNGDGRLQFAEFEAMNRKNPSLLYPLLRLQDQLRVATFGRDTWQRYADAVTMEQL